MSFESEAINGEIIETIQLQDGSIVGVGSTTDGASKLSYMNQRTTGDSDNTALVFKFNANGHLVFLKTFGGDGYNRYNNALPTTDGGFIATGYSSSLSKGNFEKYNITGIAGSVAIIVKYDNAGNVKWAKACSKYKIHHLKKEWVLLFLQLHLFRLIWSLLLYRPDTLPSL
ncbi:MAG: hypothetical protein A2Y15_08040 [Clostridiales bacterium GWF2_36_10]|nr:MAG: hypothetical protein A2Y15_08040 [Clostridiales bacterium GWF2_36_10]